MDTRQYLYCLKAKPIPGSNRPPIIKGVSNIGKLDIVWKTNMGEKGRLQTSQLQRMVRLEMLLGKKINIILLHILVTVTEICQQYVKSETVQES